MVDRLTWDEKVALVGDQVQPEISSLGLPAYTWWNEASTGVASDDNGEIFD